MLRNASTSRGIHFFIVARYDDRNSTEQFAVTCKVNLGAAFVFVARLFPRYAESAAEFAKERCLLQKPGDFLNAVNQKTGSPGMENVIRRHIHMGEALISARLTVTFSRMPILAFGVA